MCAGKLVENFSTFEENQGGNSPHAILGRCRRAFIDVELGHFYPTGKLFSQLLNNGTDASAGAAPRCPKIDQDRNVRVEDFRRKSLVTDMNQTCLVRHFLLLEFS